MADVLREELCIEATALWLLGDWNAAVQTLQRIDEAAPDIKV